MSRLEKDQSERRKKQNTREKHTNEGVVSVSGHTVLVTVYYGDKTGKPLYNHFLYRRKLPTVIV